MTNYVGTDADEVFSVGLGVNNVDGKGGIDRVNVNLANVVGNLDTFNSGGVITNNLATDDPNYLSLGLGNVENINFICGEGNDELYLFNGDDTVHGNGGDDTINTRDGRAIVDGGEGVDEWIAYTPTINEDGYLDLASSEQQAFHGGSVQNIEYVQLTLGSGDDTILTLTGRAGEGLRDVIYAGAGDDVIRVGGGSDVIYAGDGDDLAIVDFSKSRAAIDTFNSGGSVTNSLTGKDLYAVGLGDVERVNFTGTAYADDFYLFGGDDTVFGGKGDDSINTRAGRAIVDGGEGNDTWTADLSALNGGGKLNLALKSEFLGGLIKNVEAVDLFLGKGSSTIYTLTGAAGRGLGDKITAGAGNDTMKIGGGSDTINGGDGEDTLIIDWSKAAGAFHSSYSGGIVENELTGDDLCRAYIGGIEHLDIITAGGDDYLYGTNGSDTINGAAGADSMYGQQGDDTYYVDDKGDHVVEYANYGEDLVYARVNYTLEANVENATADGRKGVDLTGNALANALTGNKAANILTGGAGADVLTGGKGADTFDFNAVTDSTTDASDRITDLSGADKINLKGIDADAAKNGDQAFHLVDHFSHKAGELVLDYRAGSDTTKLMGDVDGDGKADFQVLIAGDHTDFNNFVL